MRDLSDRRPCVHPLRDQIRGSIRCAKIRARAAYAADQPRRLDRTRQSAGSRSESQRPLGASKPINSASSLTRWCPMASSEIRLSPWRALYAAVPERGSRRSAFSMPPASEGFIIDPGDPLLQIEACPGAPGCHRPLWTRVAMDAGWQRCCRGFGFTGTVHVSGCAKGCAKSGAGRSRAGRFRWCVMASCATEPRRISRRAIFPSPNLPPIPASFSSVEQARHD